MKEKYCKICDFADLDFNDQWGCEYWGCPISEVEECDDRVVDGIQG